MNLKNMVLKFYNDIQEDLSLLMFTKLKQEYGVTSEQYMKGTTETIIAQIADEPEDLCEKRGCGGCENPCAPGEVSRMISNVQIDLNIRGVTKKIQRFSLIVGDAILFHHNTRTHTSVKDIYVNMALDKLMDIVSRRDVDDVLRRRANDVRTSIPISRN